MKKRNGLLLGFVAIIFICIILIVVGINEHTQKNYLLKTADNIFESNFAKLCDNLNAQESEETNAENKKYSYLCFSVFGLTSYSDNEEMNKIVHTLYDLSDRSSLYSELSQTTVSALNKLSRDLKDNELISEVIENIGAAKAY